MHRPCEHAHYLSAGCGHSRYRMIEEAPACLGRAPAHTRYVAKVYVEALWSLASPSEPRLRKLSQANVRLTLQGGAQKSSCCECTSSSIGASTFPGHTALAGVLLCKLLVWNSYGTFASQHYLNSASKAVHDPARPHAIRSTLRVDVGDCTPSGFRSASVTLSARPNATEAG